MDSLRNARFIEMWFCLLMRTGLSFIHFYVIAFPPSFIILYYCLHCLLLSKEIYTIDIRTLVYTIINIVYI